MRPWLPISLWPDAYLPFHVPGFGVVIAMVGLTLLGFLTANFIGRSLVRFGEAMLDRMPLVRGVYKGLTEQWLGVDADGIVPGASAFTAPVLVR